MFHTPCWLQIGGVMLIISLPSYICGAPMIYFFMSLSHTDTQKNRKSCAPNNHFWGEIFFIAEDIPLLIVGNKRPGSFVQPEYQNGPTQTPKRATGAPQTPSVHLRCGFGSPSASIISPIMSIVSRLFTITYKPGYRTCCPITPCWRRL